MNRLARLFLNLSILFLSRYLFAQTVENNYVTPEQRAVYITKAQVWSRTEIADKDLLNGPGGPGAVPFYNRKLNCTYAPEKQFGGSSPKFGCRDSRTGEMYKVKYGIPTRNEVHSEILGTRLLWALGFPADRQYAVDVDCAGCPEYPGHNVPSQPGRRRFKLATVEYKWDGEDIESFEDSGWSYAELTTINTKFGGASGKEVDALRLLTAFVQHWDSKADNQRLVCSDDRAEKCRAPVLILQDMGDSFGDAEKVTRADIRSWSTNQIWKSEDSCVAQVRAGSGDQDSRDLQVSEAGRLFLLGLLKQLSDQQLYALFQGALLAYKPGNDDLAAWVRAFHSRVKQIEIHRCT